MAATKPTEDKNISAAARRNGEAKQGSKTVLESSAAVTDKEDKGGELKEEESKTEIKEVPKITMTTKKPIAKKPMEKKSEPPKKTAAKKIPIKPNAKTTEKKTMKTELVIQYGGMEISETEMVAKVKQIWKAQKKKIVDIHSIKIYVKPEENKAYYVVNDSFTGEIEL